MLKTFLFTLTFALVSATALAAPSGTVQLRGTVAQACNPTVIDARASLDLASGETNRKVATVVETCNVATGYRVEVSSSNGALQSSSGTVTYDVGMDGATSPANQTLVITRDGARFGYMSDVTVTVSPSDTRVAGTYIDTLTVSIIAN